MCRHIPRIYMLYTGRASPFVWIYFSDETYGFMGRHIGLCKLGILLDREIFLVIFQGVGQRLQPGSDTPKEPANSIRGSIQRGRTTFYKTKDQGYETRWPLSRADLELVGGPGLEPGTFAL